MFLADTKSWYMERIIRLLAGIFIVTGTLLGFLVDINWFIFPGVVGVMLTIFALTGFCPMGIILYALGARERCK